MHSLITASFFWFAREGSFVFRLCILLKTKRQSLYFSRLFLYYVLKMKKSKRIAALLIVLVMSTVFSGFALSDYVFFREKPVSAQWTAEMLCKEWEEQKQHVQTYSTDDASRERGYRIAAAESQKDLKKNVMINAVIRENAEMRSYKEDVRETSAEICNANEAFIEVFLRSLDEL